MPIGMTTNFEVEPKPILKVGVPSNYPEKDIKNIRESVKMQVEDYYLPIVIPHDVQLEVIV